MPIVYKCYFLYFQSICTLNFSKIRYFLPSVVLLLTKKLYLHFTFRNRQTMYFRIQCATALFIISKLCIRTDFCNFFCRSPVFLKLEFLQISLSYQNEELRNSEKSNIIFIHFIMRSNERIYNILGNFKLFEYYKSLKWNPVCLPFAYFESV